MSARLLALARRLAAADPADDGRLVARYAEGRDPDAFAELVGRHGPMVLGVCRRLAGNPADADDAFQATFLVLARNPGAVRPPGRVGPWLYGVARRTAAKARARAARRRAREVPLGGHVDPPDRRSAPDPDATSALDDALARLPDRYRSAVVLCELEGLTVRAAAARLGVPVGTAASRLARGRKLLADRLLRTHGPAAAGAALLTLATDARCVPSPDLVFATVRLGASAPAAGAVAAITRGVLLDMFVLKLKSAGQLGLAVLTCGASAVGVVRTAARAPADDPPTVRVAEADRLSVALRRLSGSEADVLRAGVAFAADKAASVAFLKTWVRPVNKPTAGELERLAAALVAGDEAARAAARAAISEVVDVARAELQAMATDPNRPADVRRELEALTADTIFVTMPQLKPQPPAAGGQQVAAVIVVNDIRMSRFGAAAERWTAPAAAVLARLGTPDALATVRAAAAGDPGSCVTKAAGRALGHLAEADTLASGWEVLSRVPDEPDPNHLPTRAGLAAAGVAFGADPAASVAFLRARLRPVRRPDPRQFADLVGRLASTDEKTAAEAKAELTYLAPVSRAEIAAAAFDPDVDDRARAALAEAGELAAAVTRDARLFHALKQAAVVGLQPEPGQQPLDHPAHDNDVALDDRVSTSDPRLADWRRAQRAAWVLEALGTPAARDLLREMAAGEPTVGPTKAARRALERLAEADRRGK